MYMHIGLTRDLAFIHPVHSWLFYDLFLFSSRSAGLYTFFLLVYASAGFVCMVAATYLKVLCALK